MLTKTCPSCSQELPNTNKYFYYTNGVPRSPCKSCRSAKARAKRIADPEKYRNRERNNYYLRGGAATDAAYRKLLKAKNPGKFKERTRKAQAKYRDTLGGYLASLLKGARQRSREKSLPFDIDKAYLLEVYTAQQGLCALSGLPMSNLAAQQIVPTNLSIDKIKPELGYVRGNVQLVQTRLNWMKSNMNNEELLEMCKLVLQHLQR